MLNSADHRVLDGRTGPLKPQARSLVHGSSLAAVPVVHTTGDGAPSTGRVCAHSQAQNGTVAGRCSPSPIGYARQYSDQSGLLRLGSAYRAGSAHRHSPTRSHSRTPAMPCNATRCDATQRNGGTNGVCDRPAVQPIVALVGIGWRQSLRRLSSSQQGGRAVQRWVPEGSQCAY